MPIILENEALHTALATLPFATEVNAIEDCTVDGKKHMNKNPQYNSCPKTGNKIGFANSPKSGKSANVKANTTTWNFQCMMPCTTASLDSFAPCKKNKIAIAPEVMTPKIFAARPETGTIVAKITMMISKMVKRSN